jgi:protein-tyrosine kinase
MHRSRRSGARRRAIFSVVGHRSVIVNDPALTASILGTGQSPNRMDPRMIMTQINEASGLAGAGASRGPRSAVAAPTNAGFGREAANVAPELQGKLVVCRGMSAICVEQYRRLAALLDDIQNTRSIKKLMVTSSLPREGKTLTVVNLALTLSESYNRRVLLIDADLRRPAIHAVFGLENKKGLVDVIRSGTTEMPVVEVSPRLAVLPSGQLKGAAPLAELTSECMRAAINEAASEFDWVLLDTPPVGPLPDSQLVARLCDGVVFVIAAGSTPFEVAQRSIVELGVDRIVGTVLNRVEERSLASNPYYKSYYQTR